MHITPPVSDNTEWYDLDFVPKPEPKIWSVAIYLCDRAYGGPEEGGWWYETGTRIDDPQEYGGFPPKVTTDERDAYAYANTIQECLDKGVNADGYNRDLGSVNCVGRYMTMVFGGYPPAHFPEQTPHYE